VGIRLKCVVVALWKTYNVLLYVEKTCHVVISVLGHVMIANKAVHMNCANIHVVDCLFVRTAVEEDVVSLALLVTKNATDVALMGNVTNAVPSCVNHAEDRAPGIVLTTSAKISVERNAIALAVMLPVLKNCLVATPVLACVEKTAPLCVLFVIERSFLPCYLMDVETRRNPNDVCNFSTVVTSLKLKRWMGGCSENWLAMIS